MGQINDRRELISALHVAAELEHALCCCYLFAAFSLKRNPEEGGVDWPQLKEIRNWSNQLLIVARQEMEHLGLVCNLLIAIGEQPNFRRGRFPYRSALPASFPELTLSPFDAATMRRFVEIERPEFDQLSRMISSEIADCNAADALARIAKAICSQTGWEFGQGWLWDKASGRLMPGSVPCVSSEMVKARPAFERLINENLANCLRDGTDSRFWQGKLDPSLMQHHHDDAEFLGRVFTFGRSDSNLPVAALVFIYCTRCEALDDSTAETLVTDALRLCHDKDVFTPLAMDATWMANLARQAHITASMQEPDPPATIGALYREILKAFEKLDDGTLFTGHQGSQVDDHMLTLTFPEWFNMDFRIINDLKSAKATIVQIIEEGEGTPSHDATELDEKSTVDLSGSASHFARFSGVLYQLEAMQEPAFRPARDCLSNPKSSDATLDNVAELMSIFNASYELMLETLLSFFGGAHADGREDAEFRKVLPRIFLPIMSMAIRTLGESLTLCPLHDGTSQTRAGPGFELSGAFNPQAGGHEDWRIYFDRLSNLSMRCRDLAASTDSWGELEEPDAVRERLTTAGSNFGRMAHNLQSGMTMSATRPTTAN